MITVSHPIITRNAGVARISSNLYLAGQDKALWFEVEERYADLLTDDTADSFFLTALIIAICCGEDLHVNGILSSKLFYNATHYLVPLLSNAFDKQTKITITVDKLQPLIKNSGTAVITGFSGGVDSFSTYYSHSGTRVSPEYQVSHFIYNNIGSHGVGTGEKTTAYFKQRYEALKQYAREEDKPFITLNSNMEDFITLAFHRTHTIRNCIAALLFQKSISKYLYASGLNMLETKVSKNNDMAYLDTIILPLLSTERMECIPSGGEFGRAEKTEHVTHIAASHRYLDVCVLPDLIPQGYVNCGICWKCLRTEMTFKILGKLDDYHQVFPLERFKKYENLYLIKVVSSNEPLLKEINALIKKMNYKVPLWVMLLSKIIPRFLSRLIDYKIALIAH